MAVSVEVKIEEDNIHCLLIRISGVYKYGSEGNEDAGYLGKMIQIGEIIGTCKKNGLKGIIVDMQSLSYSWGNGIHIFQFELFRNIIPIAYVTGAKCIEGIMSLSKLSNIMGNIESAIFPSMKEAVEYINKRSFS